MKRLTTFLILIFVMSLSFGQKKNSKMVEAPTQFGESIPMFILKNVTERCKLKKYFI